MVEANKKAPLEDLMVAMDVVDTLRHQQSIAERELDGEGRRERLLARLREMYRAQGIDVPDQVLEEGIAALEEERFQYRPVAPSWRTRIAHIWVSRGRWGKPLGFLTLVGGLFYGVYFATDVLPNLRLKSDLPVKIEQSLTAIKQVSENPALSEQAAGSAVQALAFLEREQYDKAQQVLSQLQDTQRLLNTEYTIRVVSRPQEMSGVWREPDANQNARNYYLIVEAIDNDNQVVELNVINEENNTTVRKKAWGLRVSEKTFMQIATDKNDDGIIQQNKVGFKRRGYLKPEFSIPTTGATITEW